jgi:copper chaperone CopZ
MSPGAGMPHHKDMAIETLHLTVRGMTCGNCARSVERKLAATPGVTKVEVDLNGSAASVEYDVGLVKPEVLAEAVRSLGYEVAA